MSESSEAASRTLTERDHYGRIQALLRAIQPFDIWKYSEGLNEISQKTEKTWQAATRLLYTYVVPPVVQSNIREDWDSQQLDLLPTLEPVLIRLAYEHAYQYRRLPPFTDLPPLTKSRKLPTLEDAVDLLIEYWKLKEGDTNDDVRELLERSKAFLESLAPQSPLYSTALEELTGGTRTSGFELPVPEAPEGSLSSVCNFATTCWTLFDGDASSSEDLDKPFLTTGGDAVPHGPSALKLHLDETTPDVPAATRDWVSPRSEELAS
ncbi:hypothetical protein JCM11251_007577 [Rhodosporidiobolus azoricus]